MSVHDPAPPEKATVEKIVGTGVEKIVGTGVVKVGRPAAKPKSPRPRYPSPAYAKAMMAVRQFNRLLKDGEIDPGRRGFVGPLRESRKLLDRWFEGGGAE